METCSASASRARAGSVFCSSCSCNNLDEGEFSSSSSSGGACASRETEERCDRGEDEEQENRFRFMDLGDRLTSAGIDASTPPPPLEAFRLRLTEESSFLMAHRWIRRALTRRPAAFILRHDVDRDKIPYHLKRPEFSFAYYCRAGGAFTCRLTTLHLHGVKLERGFAGAIAAELPVLEDLRLEECDYSFARIASTSLRHLAIDNCAASDFYVDVLVLDAPRLASLRVRGDDPPPPPVDTKGHIPSLVDASLEHSAGVDGLLRSLHNARDLSLYRFGTTALLDDKEEPGGLFPEFFNLRNLVLDECDVGVECRVLRRFLRYSPALETLALRYCSFSGGFRSRKRKARSDDDDSRVPASYECKKLRSVEIEFHEDNDVSELDDALQGITKKVAQPMESSVQNGRRTVRFSYE